MAFIGIQVIRVLTGIRAASVILTPCVSSHSRYSNNLNFESFPWCEYSRMRNTRILNVWSLFIRPLAFRVIRVSRVNYKTQISRVIVIPKLLRHCQIDGVYEGVGH